MHSWVLTLSQTDRFCLLCSVQNALSPGQIFLMIHLLDTFGFAVDAIGAHVPPPSQRGGTSFMIGPIKVVHNH